MLIDDLDRHLEVGIEDTLAEEDLAEGAGTEDLALGGNLVVGLEQLEAACSLGLATDGLATLAVCWLHATHD